MSFSSFCAYVSLTFRASFRMNFAEVHLELWVILASRLELIATKQDPAENADFSFLSVQDLSPVSRCAGEIRGISGQVTMADHRPPSFGCHQHRVGNQRFAPAATVSTRLNSLCRILASLLLASGRSCDAEVEPRRIGEELGSGRLWITNIRAIDARMEFAIAYPDVLTEREAL